MAPELFAADMEVCKRDGLRNLGNSCYFNAIEQAFDRVSRIASFSYGSTHQSYCRLGMGSCVDCHVGKAVRDSRLRGVSDIGEMRDLLREDKRSISEYGNRMAPSERFGHLYPTEAQSP